MFIEPSVYLLSVKSLIAYVPVVVGNLLRTIKISSDQPATYPFSNARGHWLTDLKTLFWFFRLEVKHIRSYSLFVIQGNHGRFHSDTPMIWVILRVDEILKDVHISKTLWVGKISVHSRLERTSKTFYYIFFDIVVFRSTELNAAFFELRLKLNIIV